MAVGKEIRTKITSVKNTQKITRAMEMVAASKLRKTQDRMTAARPYAEGIRRVIGNLSQASPDFHNPYLEAREIKRVGYLIVTSDKGLCGSLNVNLFRRLLNDMSEWQGKGVEIDLCILGAKGVAFFRRLRTNIISVATHLGDVPKMTELVGPITVMTDAYKNGTIDRLFLVHNVFVNTMSQTPEIKTLLPVKPVDGEDLQDHWDYIYEPDAADLLTNVLERYVEAQIYRAVVENIACEMASKMVAMKAATENAGKFIDQLQLVYNKARQAAITQEISEIVGGAAAV